ncbi:serine hydrolase domain-containing protein [Maridesulfovibrio sp.]|uniref:serine hydrolase domain-containing protein n=1 Tax=Maridesulfovibrio sp. TaxID=2795000 RepID=UPI003BA97861
MNKILRIVILMSAMLAAGVVYCFAQESTLEKSLAKAGAKVTMPVSAAKNPFPKDFVKQARDSFDSFHAQMGGDHTLYYLLNWPALTPTDLSMPNIAYMPLKYALDDRIGKITVKTDSAGEITLDQYAKKEVFRLQGMLLLHKGKIVYETYPGMSPVDIHWWASASKTIVGLVGTMLIEEEKLNPKAPVTKYVKELAGSAWEKVRVIDLLNHTAGLDIEETNSSILNRQSMIVRFFYSSIGTPNRDVELEDWMQVVREAKPLKEEKPGERFRYSSINTQILGQVIEDVTGLRWSDVVEQRIWGKMGARMPLFTNLTPDGRALTMAIMSSTLQDMARFGALFTPSWNAVAHEKVVTAEVLKRIREGGDPKAFAGGAKENQSIGLFGEKPIKGSHQFDFIFEDGAMYKHGNTGQGIYIDPDRDFVGVYFSSAPYVPPYGEIKAPAYIRAAARMLAGH